ncbi:hypothetical protein BUALT_Bualt05G0158100 [Buddleja alternifolia]|uniref:Uncharacterized protein n=1 Tax=Buddleja alternifolia TaxID=168488 RepID=A0AAV6XVM5_9LAMI|nr:hypothetical protein BUALT_Bualt05G0158100 [Buddleja alternifolia]
MAVISMIKLFNRLVNKMSLKNVPRGFLPVYVGVGEERKRYLVAVAVANSSAFKSLLNKYESYISPSKPLTLPCSIEKFDVDSHLLAEDDFNKWATLHGWYNPYHLTKALGEMMQTRIKETEILPLQRRLCVRLAS